MGSTVMMYVLPMMLGQTYDLGKERVGLQIFPTNVTEHTAELEQYFTDSQYRMIDDSTQVKEFLDISGRLSLKIKSGMVEVSGEGSYVKDYATKKNTFHILVKVHYETKTKTIPSYVKPRPDWRQMNEKFLGTHYCRSITYGGDLIATVSISASNSFDYERIKGAINGNINASGGSFEANVKARLEKLKSEAQDSSSMEIKYYASVPLEGVSYTLDGLIELVRKFPDQVKKVNNGIGNPLRMELYPLKGLDSSYKDYLENRALGSQLDDMDTYFDDLRITRKEIQVWISGLPPILPPNVAKKIEEFQVKTTRIYGIFLKSISELDLALNASTKPLTDALNAYKDGDYAMAQKFYRKLNALKLEIYRLAPALKPRIGGARYVRWGHTKCENAETVLSGVVSSSESVQDGGSSDILCAPLQPKVIDPKTYFPEYDEEEATDNLVVSPMIYTGALKKFKNVVMKMLPCAICRKAYSTTLLLKPGDRACPTDKWTKEYEGVLMAPGITSGKAEYVCVDKDMQALSGQPTFGNSDIRQMFELQEVTLECGTLPCAVFQANKAIPCVVCTI